MKKGSSISRSAGLAGADRRRHPAREGSRTSAIPDPDEGRAFVYGVLPVLELLRSRPQRIARITIATGVKEYRLREITEIAREQRILVDRVPRESISRMVGPERNHQGVAAHVSPVDYADEETILDASPGDSLIVVLDGVEDPRNLGAILRSVECAGADGVFIPERRAAGLTDVVAKSSAGAVEYVKVAKSGNLNRLIAELKERNIWVIGTAGDAGMSYIEWDWTLPSALVLGAEGTGLHRLVAENCDALVNIPMYGRINSLNISVAAGVILFEARRQRAVKEQG
jgi:23S rRNA (guanosine2251-2'-O)-methyltransferase